MNRKIGLFHLSWVLHNDLNLELAIAAIINQMEESIASDDI